MYERQLRKKSLDEDKDEIELEVDPVDAHPLKTFDGKLYYRTVPKTAQKSDGDSEGKVTVANENNGAGTSLVKLTKAYKRAKTKKIYKRGKETSKGCGSNGESAKGVPSLSADLKQIL